HPPFSELVRPRSSSSATKGRNHLTSTSICPVPWPSSGWILYPWLHRAACGGGISAASNEKWSSISRSSWRHGVSSSRPSADPRAVDVSVGDDWLTVELADGRKISAPLAWFPRLLRAKPDQRKNWQLMGDGM